jgi:hypothetical protein
MKASPILYSIGLNYGGCEAWASVWSKHYHLVLHVSLGTVCGEHMTT